MAQFRTTADILDLALINGGEVTNGNSPYETQLLNYLNRVHFTLLAGGTIPLGKDRTVLVDELWPWARAESPIIIDLQPKYTTGTITLTNESEAGTFSSAPTDSLKGWHLKINDRSEWFKIASHTAGATAFQLDDHYTGSTGSGLNFTAVKLDYDLIPDHIVVTAGLNNKIQFQETAGTTLTGTLTNGTYTPAQLATHVQSTLNSTGGAPTYTVSYDSTTRKFTIASDREGGAVFVLVGTGDQSAFSIHRTMGFDDENTTNAASVTSTYIFSGIARLVEPFKCAKATDGLIYGIDTESFSRNYTQKTIMEGYPDRFCIIKEKNDGTFTVRFNKYAPENTRVEVEHVPIPRDLKDSSASIPLVPRKWVDILEDAATFYLMLNKNDDRMPVYMNLVLSKLEAMIAQHRGSMLRTGQDFGRIVPRKDMVTRLKRSSDVEPYT